MNEIIKIKPAEPAKNCDLELANRILEIKGKEGRLIVRHEGRDGSDLIRVITADCSFQFKLDSPEVVEVENFENSLTSACVRIMGTVKETVDEVEKQKSVLAEKLWRTEEELKRILDELEERVSAYDRLREVLEAYFHKVSNLRDVSRKALKHWKKMKPATRSRHAKTLMRAILATRL